MGEYYIWANVSKKQYICPCDFRYGNKYMESSWNNNDFLKVLYALLDSDWAGDQIIWIGDETEITEENINPVVAEIYRQEYGMTDQIIRTAPGFDAMDMYQNLCKYFVEAKEEVSEEIELMKKNNDFSSNIFDVDPVHPYEGLFLRKGKSFIYSVNETKHEFYNQTMTRQTDYYDGKAHVAELDPLPCLMGWGRAAHGKCLGKWIGDIISVSDIKPDEHKYTDITSYDFWNRVS